MSSKKIIGTNALSYPEIRNFAGHAFKEFEFRKVFDFFKFPAYILFRVKNKINRKWQNSFRDYGYNKCDFFHFFNVISLDKKPYITTYETALPRWRDTDEDFKEGLAILAKKNCRKIIALSECAYKKQEEITRKYRADLLQTIMAKNQVLLPPQIPFINDIAEKRPCGEILVFTIVGADFFRKGGKAVLNAFDRLLTDNSPLKLNIVSTLNFGDYASMTTEQDLASALEVIEKHSGKINLFRQLENDDVKKLLLDTDVAILPSLAETFGYFILEAQAAACPVISTDIRAMPEINNLNKGWMIHIREHNQYDADLSKTEELHQSIESQLIHIILSILDNPSIIREKGKLALHDIITKHSPDKHGQRLLEIYKGI